LQLEIEKTDNMKITLDMLLQSREERWNMQRQLINENADKTLICLTVIMPGNEKRNEQSLIVARAALVALKDAFSGHCFQLTERDLSTGFEAFMLTDISLLEAKRMTCAIEDSHPLGRLFDIDIIDKNVSPVSRAAIGAAPRRCLLCNNEARFCMRNHTHTQEELHNRINEMISDYGKRTV